MSKKIRDETIIEALLISATVRSAAAKLEINEQTIYRRKRDPEFMQKYNEARRERTEAARNVLQERAHAAADTLATIMQDADAPAQTRVSAAAEILRQTVKYTEITDIMQQLDELEGSDEYKLNKKDKNIDKAVKDFLKTFKQRLAMNNSTKTKS